jgi:hypothetical protein
MTKILKDTLALALVVGSFAFGASALVREVSRPWPEQQQTAFLQTGPADGSVGADDADEVAVTYTINASESHSE